MQFKLAILKVLATRPDGRATLDELTGEVGLLTADPAHPGDASPAPDAIDIFEAGLVVLDDSGLRITDAGRSELEALEGANDIPLDFPATPASPSLKRIDELVGTKERLRIFDLAHRSGKTGSRLAGAAIEDVPSMTAAPGVEEAYVDLPPESAAQANHETGDAGPRSSEPVAEPMRAPAIQVRNDDDRAAPEREARRRPRFSGLIAARLQQIAAIWRRHLERDAPQLEARPRRTGNMNGAAIALISFLVLALAAGAVIALAQIRSLKSEVAALQRELFPLRERVAKAELLERAKQIAEQQKESQNKSKAGAEARTEQAALSLTPEEIRLIRDFIKPAPPIGAPAPAINVGDTVSIATIPLPSPLMEKIPKLLGARFTTRNGSIVILRRDSRQADIVLPPS